MSKIDDYHSLEAKVIKQRELVKKEQDKLASLENDFYKALHHTVATKAKAANMTVPEYLEAMG